MNRRLIRFLGQLRLGEIDFLTDIQHCLIGIETGGEFQGDVRAAFVGGGAHFLHALDTAQLGLHRLQQKPFGILRRDAVMLHRDVDDRDIDVRIRLFRDRHIGDRSGNQDQGQHHQGGAAAVQGGVDQRMHRAILSLLWRRRCRRRIQERPVRSRRRRRIPGRP